MIAPDAAAVLSSRMARLWVDPRHQQRFAALGLNSFEAVVKHFTSGETPPKSVWLKPLTLRSTGLQPLEVFYKQYTFRKASWKFLGRMSKARREFENYAVFEELRIPCAERVATGEMRDALGRLRQAFIITVTIPDTLPLPEYVDKYCPDRRSELNRAQRDSLIEQVASLAQRLHRVHFFHHDLVWRNVLVNQGMKGQAQAWAIDCPSGGKVKGKLFQRQRQLKDLASLDKIASEKCTTRERLRFMKHYLGVRKLDAAAWKLIRDTLNYRKKRWPDDWK